MNFRCCLVICWGFIAGLSSRSSVADDLSHAKALSQAFRDASRKVMPAVVTITVFGQPKDRRNPRNPNQLQPDDPVESPPDESFVPRELGSGVIISADGWVLTNHHVVADAEKLEVETNQQQKLVVQQVFSDPDSDLAVVRVEALKPLPFAEFGSSRNMEIGDWVLAIGSPFQLESSVSAGIISAKGRSIPRVRRALLLQTDAAINPGNSGGPLIDLEGKVVGVNTAIATQGGGYEGIGFAIPSDQASWIFNELRDHGRVRRASLGVQILSPSHEGVFEPGTEGALVQTVVIKSPAEAAGVKELDLILEIDGEPVRTHSDLPRLIERLPIDTPLPLVVLREGERKVLEVRLKPR